MTRCDRFEHEGLLLEEQEVALDAHFSTCPDCMQSRRAYGRLRQQVAATAAGLTPPADWQRAVWAALERPAPRARRFGLWALLPAGLAAAVVAVVLLVPRDVSTPTLRVEVDAQGTPARRGQEAYPGSRLRLWARSGGARHSELRVYFNDSQVILRCGEAPPCRRSGDEVEAALVLQAIGAYQPVLLVSDRPLPPPERSLDADAGAALAAGARVELGPAVQVR